MADLATPNLPARDFAATAAFYAKLGFGVIHHIVPALRHRTASDGTVLPHNLVIMSTML
jgi:predicted lactoylglutathione lyase